MHSSISDQPTVEEFPQDLTVPLGEENPNSNPQPRERPRFLERGKRG